MEGINGTDDALAATHIEDVGVDHRGLDILVSKQFLDGADVITGHQQVGGE